LHVSSIIVNKVDFLANFSLSTLGNVTSTNIFTIGSDISTENSDTFNLVSSFDVATILSDSTLNLKESNVTSLNLEIVCSSIILVFVVRTESVVSDINALLITLVVGAINLNSTINSDVGCMTILIDGKSSSVT